MSKSLLTEGDAAWWGVCIAGLPNCAMVLKARVEGLRDLGMCANPFGSFMLLQGVETLALRMERHCANTNELAQWLQYHEGVSERAFFPAPTLLHPPSRRPLSSHASPRELK